MRPANVAVPLPDSLDGDVELMTAVPPDADRLAGRLWDLSGWARQRQRAPGGARCVRPTARRRWLRGSKSPAAVLRHLQADPLLPGPLQPADWPGAGLRETYDDWDDRYRTTLRAWSRAR